MAVRARHGSPGKAWESGQGMGVWARHGSPGKAWQSGQGMTVWARHDSLGKAWKLGHESGNEAYKNVSVCKYWACTYFVTIKEARMCIATNFWHFQLETMAYLSGMSIPRRNISPRNSSLLLQTGHRKKYRPALQACCYGNNTDTSQLFTLSSLDHISSVSPVPRPPPSFHL